jgi:hypothetical protein
VRKFSLQIPRELELSDRRSDAVCEEGCHLGVYLAGLNQVRLECNSQRLLQRFAPTERQLQWLLAVKVAGVVRGTQGAALCNSLVAPEIVPVSARTVGGKQKISEGRGTLKIVSLKHKFSR